MMGEGSADEVPAGPHARRPQNWNRTRYEAPAKAKILRTARRPEN